MFFAIDERLEFSEVIKQVIAHGYPEFLFIKKT
jgi:hypothetical protein